MSAETTNTPQSTETSVSQEPVENPVHTETTSTLEAYLVLGTILFTVILITIVVMINA